MKTVVQLFALALATSLFAAETKPEVPKPICCEEPLPPTKYSERSVYTLGDTWTSDFGKEIKLEHLRGKPVVLALFFTKCQHSCPFILQDLKDIEKKLDRGVREKTTFVMATIDPERDTVEALKAYRDKHDLSPERWVLLRGNRKAVDSLAQHIGFNYTPGSEYQFAHSMLVSILNPSGEIVFQQAGVVVDRRDAVSTIQKLTTAPRKARTKKE